MPNGTKRHEDQPAWSISSAEVKAVARSIGITDPDETFLIGSDLENWLKGCDALILDKAHSRTQTQSIKQMAEWHMGFTRLLQPKAESSDSRKRDIKDIQKIRLKNALTRAEVENWGKKDSVNTRSLNRRVRRAAKLVDGVSDLRDLLEEQIKTLKSAPKWSKTKNAKNAAAEFLIARVLIYWRKNDRFDWPDPKTKRPNLSQKELLGFAVRVFKLAAKVLEADQLNLTKDAIRLRFQYHIDDVLRTPMLDKTSPSHAKWRDMKLRSRA